MQCKYKSISIEQLKELVKESISISELMRKLGYTANRGSSFIGLSQYLKDNNISTEHFKGKAHGTSNTERYSLDQILIKDSTYSNLTSLKNRVLKAGLLEYKCSSCGISKWKDKPITLQLHHINGDNRDNRIENLTLLCPNCHSQTENYCKKSKEPGS